MTLLLGLAACTAAAPAPSAAPAAPPESSRLAATLSALAEQALLEGDLDAAENRYQRLLDQLPRWAPAHVGLARVAQARGDRDTARRHFEAALASDPAAVEAHLGLAELAADPVRARALLERALAVQPDHPAVLARMAALTGTAPREARSLDDALALADAHPFDPKVLLDAGLRLREAGRTDEAIARFEAVVAVYDLDPERSSAATAALREIAPAWSGRRVVPVHVFVDAGLREIAGWRFRQRLLWQEVSAGLEPLLGARFVPASFSPFDAAPPGTGLAARLRGLAYQTGARDEAALFAGFTHEATPSRPGARRGIAVYLGRHLFVRDAPDEPTARVLAHELMHIYGGIHVADDIESLMNPSGGSTHIDALNADIVRHLASRGFGLGGQERNVLPHIDIEATAAAFSRALQVNIVLRQAGLAELLGDATLVGPGAWSRMQQIRGLDSHLADVSSFTARLFWESQRRAQAVAMLELASQLYGRQSPKGRAAWGQAEVLRRRLRLELGAP